MNDYDCTITAIYDAVEKIATAKTEEEAKSIKQLLLANLNLKEKYEHIVGAINGALIRYEGENSESRNDEIAQRLHTLLDEVEENKPANFTQK